MPPKFHLDLDDRGDESLYKELWRTRHIYMSSATSTKAAAKTQSSMTSLRVSMPRPSVVTEDGVRCSRCCFISFHVNSARRRTTLWNQDGQCGVDEGTERSTAEAGDSGGGIVWILSINISHIKPDMHHS